VAILSHYRDPAYTENVIGTLNRNPFRYWSATRRSRSKVVHYHHGHWLLLVAVALAARGGERRYVVTLHGHDVLDALESRLPLVARVTCWALRQFTAVIAVSREIATGVERCVAARPVRVLPAFVEPEPSELSSQVLDDRLAQFVLQRGPTLLVSCSQIAASEGDADPYGLDLAVDAFCELASDRADLQMAMFVGRAPKNRAERDYLGRLTRRIEASGISDRFLMCIEVPLVPAFKAKEVIYLRPTRTDGDAVSVREALSMGVPVIASDVVVRPPGTALVPVNESLATAVEQLLESSSIGRTRDARSDEKPERASEALLNELLSAYGFVAGAA
jgi:glycosyltransferase involved in cell wall biosynthesis